MNIRLRKVQLLQGIVWLVVLATTVAQAQTPEERIEVAMASARQAGIPVSLLESKRAEGQAKGVPMDRIASAIQTRLQQLEAAQRAMKRVASDVDAAQLSVGADAIGAGVSEAVLAEITSAAGRERRSIAVAALTYLVSKEGLASPVALARVKDAMAKGPEALTDLAKKSAPKGRIPDGVPAKGNRSEAGNPGKGGGPPSSIPAPGRGNPSNPPSRRGGPQK